MSCRRLALFVAWVFLGIGLLSAEPADTPSGCAAGDALPPVVTGPACPWLALREARPLDPLGPIGLANLGQAVSLAKGDFDGDGLDDLAVGHSGASGSTIALHRAEREAFIPTAAQTIEDLKARRTVAPFSPRALVIPIPAPPDFLAAGDFDRDGFRDLVAAARGSSRLWFLAGNGRGALAPAERFDLAGSVGALVVGELGTGDGLGDLIVGLAADGHGEVAIFSGKLRDGAQRRFLASEPRLLSVGDLDDEPGTELAVAVEDGVLVLAASGREWAVPMATRPEAILVHDLLWDQDRRDELAVARSDGSVHILERAGGETRRPEPERRGVAALSVGSPGLVEGLELHVGARGSGNLAPLLLPLRTSPGGALDGDLLVVDAGTRRIHALLAERPAPPEGRAGALREVPFDLPAAALQVVPMRLNILPEDGLVVLLEGESQPFLLMPAILSSITVTTTTDSIGPCSTSGTGTCSLRDAIIFSNTNAGTDTIWAPPNTVTLTIANAGGVDEDSCQTGDLDINDSVTINGHGPGSTIVQAGTTTGNGIDKVFAINPSCNKVVNTAISGVRIRHGRNTQPAGSGGSHYGGGLGWCGWGGTDTFTLSGCIVDLNTNVNSSGGGVGLYSLGTMRGTAMMTGTSIANNTSLSSGGGIAAYGTAISLVLNGGSSVTGNATSGTSLADGGGIGLTISSSPTPGTVYFDDNATIESNTAAEAGGGISIYGSPNVVILNSTLKFNKVQNGAPSRGGGLYLATPNSVTTTLTNVYFLGNRSDDFQAEGGGIYVQSGTLNVNQSNLTSNLVSSGSGGGAFVDGGTVWFDRTTFLANNAFLNGGAIAHLASGGNYTNLVLQDNLTQSAGGAFYVGGFATASLCRIVSNSAPSGSGIFVTGTGYAEVENNWWGCDGFPGAPGCQTAAGPVDNNPRIDLRLTASPETITAGTGSTLTADVTKNTDGADTNGGLAPPALLGQDLTFVNDPKGSIDAPLVVAIPAGGTVSKTFTAGSTSSACGTATPGVTLDSGTQTKAITIQCADVTVSNSAPTEVCRGATLTYTLTASNSGSAGAASVVVTDDLPDCLTSVTCTPSVGSCNVGAGNAATASLGTMASLASETVTITGIVSATCAGTLSNAATISTSTVESSTANNTSATTSTAVNVPPTITTQPSSVTVCQGSDATFSVVATGGGLTYQWQINVGVWTDLANGGFYSNVTTPTLTITGATTALHGNQYRCVVSGCNPPAVSTGRFLSVHTPSPPVAGVTVQKSGTDLEIHWTNIGGMSQYVVREDSSPSGAFTTQTGTSTSGTAGLTVPMPPGTVYYKVAGQNACGMGPL